MDATTQPPSVPALGATVTDRSAARQDHPTPSEPIFTARASRPPLRRLVVLSAVALLLVAAVLADGLPPDERAAQVAVEVESDGPALAAEAGPAPDRAVPTPGVREAASPGTERFATRRGIDLHLPAAGTVLVGFHEAARREALALRPDGQLRVNRNRTKYTAPVDQDGPAYVVLSSRGRTSPATAAADLVLEDGTPVRSPVSGRVVDVRRYLLYGEHVDHRIAIAPAGSPDRRVVLIHVDDVRVAPGDAVTAGRTVLAAGPTRFPFSSHIDVEVGRRLPHVHVEVKPAGSPRPGRPGPTPTERVVEAGHPPGLPSYGPPG